MMRDEDTRNGVLALTQGDPERARQLRANLAVFARRLDDPQVNRLVNEVLAGRRNVREVFRTREFHEVGGAHLDHLEDGLRRLPPGGADRLLDDVRTRVDNAPPAADDTAGTGSRSSDEPVTRTLNRLRDADLASSPVDRYGEVDPPPERPWAH